MDNLQLLSSNTPGAGKEVFERLTRLVHNRVPQTPSNIGTTWSAQKQRRPAHDHPGLATTLTYYEHISGHLTALRYLAWSQD